MRLVVAVVGKPRHAGLREAILDYETRAARYWPLEIHEVREESASVALVIGGAFGLDNSILCPFEKLSLAPFTLPHELARLVLAEQIYRAGTIVRGEPYHK